jgi:hypothetical protein
MVVRSPYRLREFLKGPNTSRGFKKSSEEAEFQRCKTETMSSPSRLLRLEIHNQAFAHGYVIRGHCIFR